MTARDAQANGLEGLIGLLFYVPVFHHLWFLWFLCWFVCGFALLVKLLQTLRIPAVSDKWLTSSLRYVWLIPLAAVPQYFMASSQYAYGPDTSIGLLPLPAVFATTRYFLATGRCTLARTTRRSPLAKDIGGNSQRRSSLFFRLGSPCRDQTGPAVESCLLSCKSATRGRCHSQCWACLTGSFVRSDFGFATCLIRRTGFIWPISQSSCSCSLSSEIGRCPRC